MLESRKRFDPARSKFAISLPKWKEGALPEMPVVVVAGRSNVGKSSFINMILKRKALARTSSTPGRTQALNFFDVDGRLYLADVPGYGYAKAPPAEVKRWTENVRHFVRECRSIALVVQLLDIRRDPSPDDAAFAEIVREAGKKLLIVVTKADKEGRGKHAARQKAIAAAMGVGAGELLLTSSTEGKGRAETWKKIMEAQGVAKSGGKIDVIAIDGPAGAGKSTIAKAVAKALGWDYLDTGAMYRAVGLKADRLGIALDDDAALAKMCAETALELGHDETGAFKITLDGEDVSRAIRENRVSALASAVSARKPVRDAMGAFQRRVGEAHPTVAEGRDMGTVVFPDARLKVFLTASPEKRAERRVGDLIAMGQPADRDKILAEIAARDGNDSSREHAPLKAAGDAVDVDTSEMTVEEVVAAIARLI